MMTRLRTAARRQDVLTFVCLAGICTLGVVAVSQASVSDVRSPVGWFEIGAQGRLVDLFGTADRLYFLVRDVNQYEFLRTDEIGRINLRLPLPALAEPPLTPRIVRANHSGYFAVGYVSLSSRAAFQVFDPLGNRFAEVTIGEPALDFQLLTNSLVVINYQGVFTLSGLEAARPDSAARTSQPFTDPLLTASIHDRELAIVNMRTAQFAVFTPPAEPVSSSLLRSPGIDRLAASHAGGDAVVLTMTGSTAGDLYCGLTGFKVQEGALMARFGASGQPKGEFVCKLPRLKISEDPPFGYLNPNRLAATGRYLYWADMKGRKVAYYSIED